MGHPMSEPWSEWQPRETAPRSARVLVAFKCGVIDIARQINTVDGWQWRQQDGDAEEANDPIVAWMPLPSPPST